MSKHCEGCYSLMISGCMYSHHNSDGECPCTVCVVKPMCDKRCPDYHIFDTKYIVQEDPYNA